MMYRAFNFQLIFLALCLIGITAIRPARATPASTPEVQIATEALFDARATVPPNLLLNLSIDKNTVGAAYRIGSAAIYNRTLEYQGYFNPLKCYDYAPAPKAYFEIAAAANATALHECDGSTFSGNFMNWASMSTIDLLRYGLTGGDRVSDTAPLTVLQRAFLPSDFLNNPGLFPLRSIGSLDGGNVSLPQKVTPFNFSDIKLVSCENKIIIAEKSIPIPATPCTAPTRKANGTATEAGQAAEYLLRVKVCDASEGAERTDLCQQFGENYKPVGILQRKADKMRIGLMSYLATAETNRYGGVLRSTLKFLGPKKFDGAGYTEAINDRAEWDGSSGILYANPDVPTARDSTTVKSGLINYINQFGRNGIYALNDPLSELFYEGLRYLQGKPPTADATSGLTDAMKNSFPVIETWPDPVISSCQRNQIAVVADAMTNYDFFVPGNPAVIWLDPARTIEAAVTNQSPALDAISWTRKLGGLEADASGAAGNPAKNPNLDNLNQRLTGYLRYGSYYFSGLAYWANTNNIRLDKPVRVKTFVIDFDEGGNGDIDNILRAPNKPRESQLYLAAKYGGFDDVSGEATPNPFVSLAADGVTKIQNTTLQWDANRDGIPDNYFLASQPGTLVKALRKINPGVAAFSSMTLAAPAVSTNRLIPFDSFLYQAGFYAPQWMGNLKKRKISTADPTNSASALTIAATPEWEAGALLTGSSSVAAQPSPENRKLYTSKLGADQSLQTIEFKWELLSRDQQAMLNTTPLEGLIDFLGGRRVDYLRGVRTDELGQPNGFLRRRSSLLGDIVNSNVVHVGAPTTAIQGDSYKTFYDLNKDRSPALYVGANDGMLHAFDAQTGIEKFAYIPSLLLPKLSQLTSPDYEHRPYMDGQITVAEARVGSQWKTVLASGFGGGAQGVFAIDVTNPDNFSGGGGALLEFSDADDADMGNLMGAPVIAKFKTAVNKGIPEYKYFIVVPSGLNNHKKDGKAAESATGALFLLSLNKPASEAWSLGENYYKIMLPNLNPVRKYGVSPPAIAVGPDGAARYGYVGDLQGNLWRLDFTGLPPWSEARGSNPDTPLFSAVDGQRPAMPQPITMQPKIVFAPSGGYVVLFGTGKFVEAADLAPGNFSGQSFYAIHDSTLGADRIASRAELQQRPLTSTQDTYTISGDKFIYPTTSEFDSLVKKGWYLDFANASSTGERAVTNPLVVDGQLYFNTIMPGSDPCTAGKGRAYSLDALYGLSAVTTGYASTVGLLSAPVLFQMDEPSPGHRNAVGKRIASKNLRVLHVGTGASGNSQQSVAVAPGGGNVAMPAGRFSWREIVNWQELREAAMAQPKPKPKPEPQEPSAP